MFEQELQQKILRAFFDSFNWSPDQVDLVRPDPRFGDVAMACHPFSRELKKSPQEIAETIADRIASDDIASLDATAGYINIRFSPAYLAEQILGPIVEHGNNFGTTKNFPEKISRETMVKKAWNHDNVLDRTVNTHLTNLRNKMPKTEFLIESPRGTGLVLKKNHDSSTQSISLN